MVIAAAAASAAASAADEPRPTMEEEADIEVTEVSRNETKDRDQIERERWRKIENIVDKHARKIRDSGENLDRAFEGLLDNFVKYMEESFKLHGRSFFLYTPHLERLLYSIPGKAYHKLALNMLKTHLRQCKDHCGNAILKYNPIHPDLTADNARAKREAEAESDSESETMTLAKFGQALSTFATDVDKAISEYLAKALPSACNMWENWLTGLIAHVEKSNPDDFKMKIMTMVEFMT